MGFLVAALMLLGGDTLILKERVVVAGRYVRLMDLIDPSGLSETLRGELEHVYLGKAPEGTASKEVTAEEIRREIEHRGIHAPVDVQGERVVITVLPTSSETPAENIMHRMLAAAIRANLLNRFGDLVGADLEVRIALMNPDVIGEIVEVAPLDRSDRGAVEFRANVKEAVSGRRVECSVIAQVIQYRTVLVAARDLPANHVLTIGDLSHRRLMMEENALCFTDSALLVGARLVKAYRKEDAVRRGEVKLKPVIRRRDVVRARGSLMEPDAVALEEGAIGDVIALEFPDTKHTFRGRIVSAGLVEIVPRESRP